MRGLTPSIHQRSNLARINVGKQGPILHRLHRPMADLLALRTSLTPNTYEQSLKRDSIKIRPYTVSLIHSDARFLESSYTFLLVSILYLGDPSRGLERIILNGLSKVPARMDSDFNRFHRSFTSWYLYNLRNKQNPFFRSRNKLARSKRNFTSALGIRLVPNTLESR